MSEHITLLQDLDSGKNCCQEAAAAIRQLEAENASHQWIPVSERLPERYARVLLAVGEDRLAIGMALQDGKFWSNGTHVYPVTHWMVVAPPTKEHG